MFADWPNSWPVHCFVIMLRMCIPQGVDTVEANRMLGLPDDSREYTAVKDILEDINVQSIGLMTNNPRKVCT